jgi:hypothetical protein
VEKNQWIFGVLGQFWENGTGVPPVNHAQDARATFELTHYHFGHHSVRVLAILGVCFKCINRFWKGL